MRYTGKITKGIAGFYYVWVEDEGEVVCKAKGIFRNRGQKPLVGDLVELEITAPGEGSIVQILERKNSLIRPAVANVDLVLAVFAVKNPAPQLTLLDRFLVAIQKQGVEVAVVFNKTDLTEESETTRLRLIYENAGFKTLTLSAGERPEEAEEIREMIKGKTTVLSGPSGVGKSTIMNCIKPEAAMETGEISEKIKRGKHTTRHTELVHVDKSTFLLDTPGFSSLYLLGITPQELGDYYPEIKTRKKDCYYAGCAHINEPDCAVKDALKAGEISQERYNNYTRLYSELVEACRRF